MCAVVVSGFVFPYQAKRLAWKRLRNDLFCAVEPPPLNNVTGLFHYSCNLSDESTVMSSAIIVVDVYRIGDTL